MEETKNRADQLDICRMYKGMSMIQISHLFTIGSVANTRDHSAKVLNSPLTITLFLFNWSNFHGRHKLSGLPQNLFFLEESSDC